MLIPQLNPICEILCTMPIPLVTKSSHQNYVSSCLSEKRKTALKYCNTAILIMLTNNAQYLRWWPGTAGQTGGCL